MTRRERIKLTKLIINSENYRFDSVSSEREAIDLLISDQQDKLFRLAENICENGLSPIEMVLVTPYSNGEYSVLEGNRRVLSLKLVRQPSLIEHLPGIRSKFEKLHQQYSSTIPTLIECIVEDDPEDANKWIKQKHAGQLGGVGTVEWDPLQTNRFEAKAEGKSSLQLQAVEYLKTSSITPRSVRPKLELKRSSTTLGRLLEDPNVRARLGLSVADGKLRTEYTEDETVRILSNLVSHLQDNKITSRILHTRENRSEYLTSLGAKVRPKGTRVTPIDLASPTSVSRPNAVIPKPKVVSAERVKMISRVSDLPVNTPKAQAIVRELAHLKTQDFNNAVGVLFRVFFELSVDTYMDKMGLSLPANKRETLANKTEFVVDDLVTNRQVKEKEVKVVRRVVKSPDDILSIETWHSYVHSQFYTASPKELHRSWDNVYPFLKHIWSKLTSLP